MKNSNTPLDVIFARICQEHGIEASNVDEAIARYEELSMRDDVPQKKLAASLLAVGWFYRKDMRKASNEVDDETSPTPWQKAEHMFLQAVRYFRVSVFEQSRDTARALWFMAENHYLQGNFDLAKGLFWRAIKDFSSSVGLNDEEAKACMVEFAELAEGFARDEELAEEVDDVLGFAAFCEEMGGDGHIHLNVA